MIQTTQQKAIAAFSTLTALRKKVKGKDALSLFRLKAALQINLDFQTEEEMKLVSEYGGRVTDDGRIIIENAEKRTAFQQAFAELGKLECEVSCDPVSVSLDKSPEITLEEIEALDGFVNFE